MTPKDKGGGARKKPKKCHEKFFLAPPSLSLAYKPGKVYGEKTSIWSGLLKSKPIQKSGIPMDVKSMKIQLKLKNSNSISPTVFLCFLKCISSVFEQFEAPRQKATPTHPNTPDTRISPRIASKI